MAATTFMPSSERLSKQPWSPSFALLIAELELHRHGPLVTVAVPSHIPQTSSKLPARPHPSWRQQSPAQVMGEPPRPATCLVRKGQHAHAGRWVRDSNPAPGCFAVQGRGGGCLVTCDCRSPTVTARDHRGPAVPDAVRTQRGPGPRAWEAVSGGAPSSDGPAQRSRPVTAVDPRRPSRTAAWGTSRARPARTNLAQPWRRWSPSSGDGRGPSPDDHPARWQARTRARQPKSCGTVSLVQEVKAAAEDGRRRRPPAGRP